MLKTLIKNPEDDLSKWRDSPHTGIEWLIICRCLLGSPVGLDGKESACNAWDLGLIPGLGRSPGGWRGNPSLVFLPGEFPDFPGKNLVGYSPWGLKELDMTEGASTEAQMSITPKLIYKFNTVEIKCPTGFLTYLIKSLWKSYRWIKIHEQVSQVYKRQVNGKTSYTRNQDIV